MIECFAFPERLSATVWKVALINKIFQLPPPFDVPIPSAEVLLDSNISRQEPATVSTSLRPIAKAVPMKSEGVAEMNLETSKFNSRPDEINSRPIPNGMPIESPDFFYPSSFLRANNAEPRLIAELRASKNEQTPEPPHIEWSNSEQSNGHSEVQSEPSSNDVISSLSWFSFPPNASLFYELIAFLPAIVQLKGKRSYDPEDRISDMPTRTNTPSPDPTLAPDPIIAPDPILAPDLPQKMPTYRQPQLWLDRSELGSLLLRRPKRLLEGRTKMKRFFNLSSFDLTNQSSQSNDRWNDIIKQFEDVLWLIFNRSHHQSKTHGYLNPNSDEFNSDEFNFDESKASLLIRDLQFFPLWVVGFLSDVFDCR